MVASNSPAVDEHALFEYLQANWTGPLDRSSFLVTRFTSGHSNLTYLIEVNGERYVLRRPPPGPLPPTAHDVLRECRILECLSSVRAPRPVLACADASVIGAPFYVMEFVDGIVIGETVPPEFEGADVRRVIGEEVVTTLVEIHTLDWRSAGLGDLARSTGYLDRQIRRWRGQWEVNRTRAIPQLEELGDRLEAAKPASSRVSLVHGDYKLDNLIFSRGSVPRCLAVADWEMATIGDPLADLGYLLAFWLEPDEAAVGPLALGRATAEPGFESRDQLRMRYESLTGRPAEDLGWYEALALWKLAVLLEGSYRRFTAGTTDDPFFAELGEGIPMVADRALEMLDA